MIEAAVADDELQAAIAAGAEERFDLTATTPVRAYLFRLPAGDYVLLLVIHHIATDGCRSRSPRSSRGHSSISTTLNIYTHVVDTSRREAIEALERELFPSVHKLLDGPGRPIRQLVIGREILRWNFSRNVTLLRRRSYDGLKML